MKKTIVITSIALVFAVGNINAETPTVKSKNYKVEKVVSNVNAFCISIAKGDSETVQKLITLGEDVNSKSNGMTPLMYAARFNRVEILKLLIANGAELKTKSQKGFTALKYAKLSSANDAVAILEQAISSKKSRKS
jgi:ankyrin repeat protein